MQELFFRDNALYLREQVLKAKQSEMPVLIGFKQTTWSNYERGASTPNLTELLKISEMFGVSEYDLLYTNLEVYNPTIPLNNGFLKTYIDASGAHKNDVKGGAKSNIPPETPQKNTKEGVATGHKLQAKLHPTLHPTPKNANYTPPPGLGLVSEDEPVYGNKKACQSCQAKDMIIAQLQGEVKSLRFAITAISEPQKSKKLLKVKAS